MFSNNYGLGSLLKEGAKHFSGVDEAIIRNIEACKQMSQITRTSLGPNGMNKIVINHLDKLFVTSDAATIVKELEIVHPAAKMIVLAAKMQEQEVGDGTNLVIVLAGELLTQAESILRMGLHPSEVISGYEKASKKAIEILDDLVCYTLDDIRNKDKLAYSIRTVIAAKHFGYEDLLSGLIAEACLTVMPRNPKNFNVDNVRVAKILGSNLFETRVLRGLVVTRDAEGSIKHVKNAKVAVFGCPLDTASTETKGTVLLHNADELMNYSKGEENALEKVIKEVADAGVNVIVSGGSIGELALHYIEKYEMMAVKILSKFELRRLCRAIGATALVRVGAPTAEEVGSADEVTTEEIGSQKVTIFRRDTEDSKVATLVVRGSTQNLLDDVERAVDDAVNVVKSFAKDARFVPGAGATEIELAHRIQQFGAATPGLDQYAINKFAETLEIIPRTLAENAGLSATDTLSGLYAAHHKGEKNVGIDVEAGGVKDVAEAGVLDHLATKMWAIKLAADAALTVLRVDQIIMAKPAGGPAPKGPAGQDEYDD
eukprot:GILJ01001029.1.p1 GENE.GILJ01001029.1~~GILJ01001029.1.p1  ORF type:complete len:543 (-),score=112.98 GILJ01001029.1:275-1903(-)